MEHTLNKEKPEVRLRVFRAIDDPETCARFVEGHINVLASIGVTKVTSSKNHWINNPAAFVMVVESMDSKHVFGGARVHVAGGSELLPIEEATSAIDRKVFKLVWDFAQYGAGEVCGLWNSREIAGYGIGSIFLVRTAIAISTQIGLQSLFALCAPYTIAPAQAVGMEIETSIGNEGTFYYPKLDLVATAMLLKDVPVLSKAAPDDRESIMKIRSSLNVTRVEVLRKKEITIHYSTQIPNLEEWDLNAAILQAKANFLNAKPNVDELSIF